MYTQKARASLSALVKLSKAEGDMDFADLRRAVEKVELIDAHAHNIVELNSNLPFICAFFEAHGDAVSFVPHSISFKVFLHHFFSLFTTTVAICYKLMIWIRRFSSHTVSSDKEKKNPFMSD